MVFGLLHQRRADGAEIGKATTFWGVGSVIPAASKFSRGR